MSTTDAEVVAQTREQLSVQHFLQLAQGIPVPIAMPEKGIVRIPVYVHGQLLCDKLINRHLTEDQLVELLNKLERPVRPGIAPHGTAQVMFDLCPAINPNRLQLIYQGHYETAKRRLKSCFDWIMEQETLTYKTYIEQGKADVEMPVRMTEADIAPPRLLASGQYQDQFVPVRSTDGDYEYGVRNAIKLRDSLLTMLPVPQAPYPSMSLPPLEPTIVAKDTEAE